MRRLKVTLQYDGTAYHGFQVQGEMPTVQRELERAIASVTGERVRVIGAGRTDAGVHARGQVVHFNTSARIPADRVPMALNSLLPRDIVAVKCEEVPHTFHARYSALSKTYTYTFWNDVFPSPFWRRYSYHVAQRLDDEAMRHAAAGYIGRHDFSAFMATGRPVRSAVRTVWRAEINRAGAWVVFLVEADGFLYNMVRIMAGTLLEVGLRKRSPESVMAAILEGRRTLAGPTLPPHGLCLEMVKYPSEPPEPEGLP